MVKTHTLLAVDDRPENLFVLAELIAQHVAECRLRTAGSAEEGLALAAETAFDGVLIDVQMPGVDGIEMCRRLKADEANKYLPIILITAHGSTSELRAHGLEAGADDFISRPIDNIELAAKIRVMLRIKRAEDELRAVNTHLEELVAERTRALQQSEAKLQERTRLNQILLDSMPCVALLLRPQTREIVASNEAAAKVGAVPGKRCYATWGQRDDPCPWCLAPELWATTEARHLEVEGMGVVWDAHWLPVSKDLYMHYAFDVTDRKQAEKEREKLIAELEANNAELERFTYTVSHDLKSPLITIKGYLGCLKEDMAGGVFPGDTADAVEDDVARMTNAADKMERMLHELLDLSRIGRVVNPFQSVALGELAREAVELLGGRIDQAGVRVEIADDLPVVFGDRPRLSEVMHNLVDNALKYLGDQPRPQIEIGTRPALDTASQDNESICFVRDNGIGIEPRYQERIFGLFDQLDNKAEGSGIGLALVKRIVEVHGGRIWVESEGPGQGSTFCFSVPPSTESAATTGGPHSGRRSADRSACRG